MAPHVATAGMTEVAQAADAPAMPAGWQPPDRTIDRSDATEDDGMVRRRRWDAAADHRGRTMYARSFTIHARTSALDTGIRYLHDTVWPALTGLDGYVGLSFLADRLTGRCIATTAWQSEEAMNASRLTTSPFRDRLAEILGGSPTVDEWEIAVVHRDHHSVPGASVRVTWARVDSEHADRAIDGFRLATIPALEELEGFCSASLMVDRDSGFGVASVTFDSPEAMRRSRAASEAMKAATVRDADVEVLDECEFDLVLAHLRVPEMA